MNSDMSEFGLDDKVLLKIAQGFGTFYALTAKANVGSNDGVLAALKRLLEKRLIVEGKPGSRGSKPYLLTEDGFDYVLRFIKLIDDIDSFADFSVEFFPLVFGYWKSLGDYGLQDWVLDILRSEIPKIDVEIWSQIVMGDRARFSHEEFINTIYTRIYGPWLMVDKWDVFVQTIPIMDIKNFLNNHSEILMTRMQGYKNNNEKINRMEYNNESYRNLILEKKVERM